MDYTDINTNKDIDGTPRIPSTFLLVHRNLAGEWILRYQSDRKLDKQQWTAEDLKGVDTVVIARSIGKMEPYRKYLLGNEAVVEYVTLMYYDTATGELVKTETISAKLPIRVPEANGYEKWWRLAPSRTTEQACRTLGVPFISDSLFRACRVTTRVTGIATAVLLLLRIWKLRSEVPDTNGR